MHKRLDNLMFYTVRGNLPTKSFLELKSRDKILLVNTTKLYVCI